MKNTKLSDQHLRVWNKLENLKPGERILGRELTAIAGIENERRFHAVIEELRSSGHAIDASKSSYDAGYYPLKQDHEVIEYLFKKTEVLEIEIERQVKNTETFFKNKYGSDFNFVEYKAKEELNRYEK